MTKGELKGLIYLKINGGYPNTDNSVWLSDVDSLLPAAVNYVMTGQYYADRNAEEGDKSVQQNFLQSYTSQAVAFDTTRQRFYTILPAKIISLPKSRALVYVGNNIGKGFIPLMQGDEQMEEFYTCFKKNVTSYQLEGDRVYYWDLPVLTTTVTIKMLVNIGDVTDATDIKLPSGGELQVVQLMFDWFSGQREMPKDYVNNSKDINSAS